MSSSVLDKDSNIVWKYLKQAHHDLDIGPDGKVYAMLHSVIKDPWPGLERIKVPFIDDQVAVLDENGKELKIVSVLEAIQNSPYVSILQYARPDRAKGDLLHANSITYLDAKTDPEISGRNSSPEFQTETDRLCQLAFFRGKQPVDSPICYYLLS